MSDAGKTVACILAMLILCAGSKAIVADSANPYQGIVDRNVFGLKPPPQPAKPEEKKIDLPPIILTGITTILGTKRALMNVQAPGKPQSFILAEGQRDGDIEVVEIDEKAAGGGSVKVNQSGTPVTLTFEKNGPKLPASVPAVVAQPNPNPGFVPPQPAGVNAVVPTGAPPNPMKTLPTRTIRLPGATSPPTPGSGPAGATLPGFGNGSRPQPGIPQPNRQQIPDPSSLPPIPQ